jgi:Uncharacterized protein conserved in bacteria, COG1307
MNKRKLGIVVDSTCGNTYGKNFFEDISVVPLTLIVGETSYMDGAIDNTTLLNFIENKQKVTTSQPNPELFIKAFKEQFDLGYKHVICLTLSSKLSGTHNSALLAKKMLNNPNITVIDTQNIVLEFIFSYKESMIGLLKTLMFALKQSLIKSMKKN